MKIKPFGINIQIEPIVKKQILVSDLPPLCDYGKVVAVGFSVQTIKEGDTVIYIKWGMNEVEIDDSKYFFVPETSEFILGVLDEA